MPCKIPLSPHDHLRACPLLAPQVKAMVESANLVVNHFARCAVPARILEAQQRRSGVTKKLEQSATTRFATNGRVFHTLLMNEKPLRAVARSPDYQDASSHSPTVAALLQDDNFWEGLKFLVKVIHPIADGIAKMETERATLADTYYLLQVRGLAGA